MILLSLLVKRPVFKSVTRRFAIPVNCSCLPAGRRRLNAGEDSPLTLLSSRPTASKSKDAGRDVFWGGFSSPVTFAPPSESRVPRFRSFHSLFAFARSDTLRILLDMKLKKKGQVLSFLVCVRRGGFEPP